MQIRKYFSICAAMILAVTVLNAGTDSTPQEAYIRKYAPVAVREMYRSGVPASITLAQGLIESGNGQSVLAVKGNNHFGIKCHDWTGRKMYHDDDKRGECFRVYATADESFRDHSDFLRYRDRYKSLFDNDITDYKAWAHGLKKAGYATDPTYASKLITVIEKYRLYDYDTMTSDGKQEFSRKDYQSGQKLSRKDKKELRKTERSGKSSAKAPDVADNISAEGIPDSPLSIEEPVKVKMDKGSEKFSFQLSRQVYSINGTRFIYACEGETYASIAEKYNLFRKEILRFNDVDADRRLQVGETVYIQAKKSRTARGLDKYISDEGGESLWQLSQRFGLRLKDLCKMNSLPEKYVTLPGDELKLR